MLGDQITKITNIFWLTGGQGSGEQNKFTGFLRTNKLCVAGEELPPHVFLFMRRGLSSPSLYAHTTTSICWLQTSAATLTLLIISVHKFASDGLAPCPTNVLSLPNYSITFTQNTFLLVLVIKSFDGTFKCFEESINVRSIEITTIIKKVWSINSCRRRLIASEFVIAMNALWLCA